MKIGYQGIAGAYSEIAARQLFKGLDDEYIGLPTFEAIFSGVHDGSLDVGVIPIENSLAGSIHKNIDLLNKFDLKIVGELYQQIRHNLMAVKGARIDDITEVYSHWQALAQCEDRIKKTLPRAAVREYFDTAGAAQYVANEKNPTKAAIASDLAAQTYGLEILQKDFQDMTNNFTRFVVIHRGFQTISADNAVPHKTSITFSGNSVPGFLYKVLAPFATRSVNLTKIESRPVPERIWHYFFYVDFEGNADNPDIHAALEEARLIAPDLKILGSYPASAR